MATQKQKLAVAKLVENGRNVSGAMRAAGYSPKTAVDPSKLTNSKGFRELALEAGITVDDALVPIRKGLKAKRIVEVEGDFIETEVDDLNLQLKASDRALKLLGLAQEAPNNTFIGAIIADKAEFFNDNSKI